MPTAAGMAYREAGDRGAQAVLFVHGYPETSFMWRTAVEAVAEAGFHAIAPDLPGFGDSPPGEAPGTWEAHVEALERLRNELELGPDLTLVTHDWGVMIGLRWACDHPGVATRLVISDGGFFADLRWHDFANVLRTPGEGEKLMEGFTREGFDAVMSEHSDEARDHYWKAFATPELRRRHIELYRSGDFEKLARYEGCLARLGVPALILWGGKDRFASPRMAQRFHDELPGSEVVVLEDAGHFVWEDEPDATAAALVRFLGHARSL